jgi:hypothetical protein
MSRSRPITTGAFAALLLAQPTVASASTCDTGATSAKAFASTFYSWYFSNVAAKSLPWSTALKDVPQSFKPGLLTSLSDDAAAQAAADEIVGLDFDPFLNAQDPADSYSIGAATEQNGQCLIQVLGKIGSHPPTVNLTAVVVGTPGHWQFQNFRYGNAGDLLTILNRLKAERAQSK